MKNIEVLSFNKKTTGPDNLIGIASVKINNIKLLCKIWKGKNQNFFAYFPTEKIKDQRTPVFQLEDEIANRELLKKIMELVKAKGLLNDILYS